jgi:hypothetical protein
MMLFFLTFLPFEMQIKQEVAAAFEHYEAPLDLKKVHDLYLEVKVEGKKLTIGFPSDACWQEKFHPRSYYLYDVLLAMHHESLLPDGAFYFGISDGAGEEGPVLVFCKKRGTRSILIPDFEALNGYEQTRLFSPPRFHSKTIAACLAWPWEKKRGMAVWRGSRNHPIRSKLVALSSPLIDAAFGDVAPMGIEEQHAFKYLIDVDGWTSAWSKTYWGLLSNSVLLKVESDFIEWYFPFLKPFVHYIPVASDLSDLEEQVRFCEEHEEKVRQVAEEATRFALEALSKEENRAYLRRTLEEVARYGPLVTNQEFTHYSYPGVFVHSSITRLVTR